MRLEWEVDRAATTKIQEIGVTSLAVQRTPSPPRGEPADIRPPIERAFANRTGEPRNEEVRSLARAGPDPVADGVQRMIQVYLLILRRHLRSNLFPFPTLFRSGGQ